MKLRPITSAAPLVRVVVESKDWEAQSPETLLWITQQIPLIRRFEEGVLRLKDQDLVYGPVHTSIGQEAVAVGVASALRASDKVSGSHRAHHHYLAKVLSAVRPANHNPLNDGLTSEMEHAVQVLLAEIMGLAEGCCGGRGGSMHLYYAAGGVIGTNAIVAGGVPHATGAAWADKYLGRDNVTVCFFGEGSIYQGVVHESSNLGALWDAPIIYLIENNQYAVATTPRESCSAKNQCAVGGAYDMPGMQVDGMDPLALKLAIEHVVAGGKRDRCHVTWRLKPTATSTTRGSLRGVPLAIATRPRRRRGRKRTLSNSASGN